MIPRKAAQPVSRRVVQETFLSLSPLGERVARAGAFFSRRGTGEGVTSLRVVDRK
jgi:hypothetical protein